MVKTCKVCTNSFKIITEEKKFLDKMGIPMPEECPACRQKRRMSLRNEYKFYKYPCVKCKEQMVTTYNPNSGYIVYCLKCYADFRANVDLTKI